VDGSAGGSHQGPPIPWPQQCGLPYLQILATVSSNLLPFHPARPPPCARAPQIQLKGHRSVGGMRASIYNSMPLEGVQQLADFMAEFAAAHK
jgi:hypothetical protein